MIFSRKKMHFYKKNPRLLVEAVGETGLTVDSFELCEELNPVKNAFDLFGFEVWVCQCFCRFQALFLKLFMLLDFAGKDNGAAVFLQDASMFDEQAQRIVGQKQALEHVQPEAHGGKA